jgi:hypothetical protein
MMPKVSLQRKSYEVLLDAFLGRSKIPNLQTQRDVFSLRVLGDYDLIDLCGWQYADKSSVLWFAVSLLL